MKMIKQWRGIRAKSSFLRSVYITTRLIWFGLEDLDIFFKSFLHLVEGRINKTILEWYFCIICISTCRVVAIKVRLFSQTRKLIFLYAGLLCKWETEWKSQVGLAALTFWHQYMSLTTYWWLIMKMVCSSTRAQALNLLIGPSYLNSGHFTLIPMFPVSPPTSLPCGTQGIKSHVKRVVSAALPDALERNRFLDATRYPQAFYI